jgi:hypothetical protein
LAFLGIKGVVLIALLKSPGSRQQFALKFTRPRIQGSDSPTRVMHSPQQLTKCSIGIEYTFVLESQFGAEKCKE